MEYQVRALNLGEVDPMVRGYLEAAEWCGLSEEDREALELSVSPKWSRGSLARAEDACEDFMGLVPEEMREAMTPGEMGHNLWLTRNRHGAGFWDRGLGPVGEELTKWAHTLGETWATFDEDEEILELE
jgi:hypothetical protein